MKYARFLDVDGDHVYINPSQVVFFRKNTTLENHYRAGVVSIVSPEDVIYVKADLDHVATVLENALNDAQGDRDATRE